MTGDAPAPAEVVQVRLLRFPVRLHARAQQHADDLLREFTLIAQDQAESRHEPPARLLALVAELTSSFGGFTREPEAQIARAVAAGIEEMPEVVFHVPRAAGPAAQHLADLLDEADAYCRNGRHLLTLATPEPAKRFRDWYLGEFVRQTAGAPPTSWPDYAASAGHAG